MYTLRRATANDIETIQTLDHLAPGSEHRQALITRSVHEGQCIMIEAEAQAVGYAVLEYSFYEMGFIAMLYLHPDHRHQGAGTLAMKYFETICRTPKLFTSTNLSNLPMQSLLAKLGYELAGVIHHLDEGDPELVYIKYLQGK